LKAPTPLEIDSTPVSSDAAGRADRDRIGHVRLRAPVDCAFPDPDRDHQVHHGDERIGRQGEGDARLADPTQVHDCEQHDQEQRKADLVRRERRRHGRNREYAGRYGDGDGQYVVDQERCGRH
jgi:hypothetical protein